MASEMAIKLSYVICIVLYMAKFSSQQQRAIFDPMDYEAVGDGETDDSQAMEDAWMAACENRGPALFVIPRRTFMAGPVTLSGPCFNRISPKVQILGTVKALTTLKDFYEPGWFEFKRLDKLEISGGGTLDGQGATAWSAITCPKERHCDAISLRLLKVSNSIVSNLTIVNSKGFQVTVQRSSNVTIRHLNISAPADSPNTDGVHVSNSDNVNLTSLTIATGDDCISIGPGSVNISISKLVCGPGHGISIGSLGKYVNETDVVGVHAKNCTLLGTTNGLRIKTWPDSPPSQALNITFEDIVMKNVSNAIIIDQQYCPDGACTTHEPSRVKIRNVTYKKIRGTSSEVVAVDLMCSKAFPCENVQLHDIDLKFIASGAAAINSSCSNVEGLVLGTQSPHACIDETSKL